MLLKLPVIIVVVVKLQFLYFRVSQIRRTDSSVPILRHLLRHFCPSDRGVGQRHQCYD